MALNKAHQIISEAAILHPLLKHTAPKTFSIPFELSPIVSLQCLQTLWHQFGQFLVVVFSANSVFVISVSSCFWSGLSGTMLLQRYYLLAQLKYD